MKLKNIFRNDESDGTRAVSPVIGVILMVAITVILAAVIGTFVLGLGDQVESAPQASFNFDTNDDEDTVEIVHRGGDNINTNNVDFRVSNMDEVDSGPDDDGEFVVEDADGTLRAGDTVTIQFDADDDTPNDETVNIVFTSGDRQDIIGTFNIPEDTFSSG